MVDGKCKTASDLTWDVIDWDRATKFLDPRHNGGLNVLYADNHVKWFNINSASQTEIEKTFKWGAVGAEIMDWPY